MNTCKKCNGSLPDGAIYCPWCGYKQEKTPTHRKRGNGQGTVLLLPNGKYKAVVVTGYYTDPETGKRHRTTRSKTCDRKKDAVAAIPKLLADPKKATKQSVTFKALYDAWLPTHRAGKTTLDCYKAAMKHFKDVWSVKMSDLDVDDLQECLDACPHGRRTKENMKAVCGLVYKYGIPRKVIPDNLNLAPFLIVEGEASARRDAFTDIEIEKIKKACGKIPHAEDIYCLIYTGFRPSEFLALTSASYDTAKNCLIGGGKTKAGTDRVVTISPKITPIIRARMAADGVLFPDDKGHQYNLKDFTEAFYTALEQIGIDNPLVEVGGGKKRHRLTPHSCRHTFATLMKRVPGASKDKQELIGHASAEMLMYYEDSTLDDKRKITDAL